MKPLSKLLDFRSYAVAVASSAFPSQAEDADFFNSEQHQRFLRQAEDANPAGTIYAITDNLSSHDSKRPGPGWSAIPASGTPSSPSAPAG